VSAPGACILDAEGLKLTSEERKFFAKADPFGFILFARNIDTPEQVRALCADMRDAAGRNALITIDQEGGRVQRLRAPYWREWPSPMHHVRAAGENAECVVRLRYRIIAQELFDLGIDSNCAPLADVACDGTHGFLRDRCFSDDPRVVGCLARAAADGMIAGGVLPVVKHLPGHGRSVTDSHVELPVVRDDAATLRGSDFEPFRRLNDLPLGMTAHVVYEALDPRPATLSPKVMQLIRDTIGFDGLIMTDDISMRALSGSLTEITQKALNADCDLILHCNGSLSERAEVADAAGCLDEEGQARAKRALATRRIPDTVDIPALEAKLDVMLKGRADG